MTNFLQSGIVREGELATGFLIGFLSLIKHPIAVDF
jgi:hypothetical protein